MPDRLAVRPEHLVDDLRTERTAIEIDGLRRVPNDEVPREPPDALGNRFRLLHRKCPPLSSLLRRMQSSGAAAFKSRRGKTALPCGAPHDQHVAARQIVRRKDALRGGLAPAQPRLAL